MEKIKHKVGVKTTLKDAYEATHCPEKLLKWWPEKASGGQCVGEEIILEFPGYPKHTWKIMELSPSKKVVLRAIKGPSEWEGSVLKFEFSEREGQVWITLTHTTGLNITPGAYQFFCTKWPMFLVSLKAFLEIGSGMPYPNDIKIQV